MNKDKELFIRQAPRLSKPMEKTEKTTPQKVKILHSGVEHDGVVIEQKLDKYKIQIIDLEDKTRVVAVGWYDHKQFKRIW